MEGVLRERNFRDMRLALERFECAVHGQRNLGDRDGKTEWEDLRKGVGTGTSRTEWKGQNRIWGLHSGSRESGVVSFRTRGIYRVRFGFQNRKDWDLKSEAAGSCGA